jgi:hypothetical protein
MRDESLDPHLNTVEIDAIARLDERIVRALEKAPAPRIPVDFAARVVNALPAKRPVSLTPTYFGHYAMLISMVVLLGALLFLSPHTSGGSVLGLTLQWMLCAQFIGLAVWLSVRRYNAL